MWKMAQRITSAPNNVTIRIKAFKVDHNERLCIRSQTKLTGGHCHWTAPSTLSGAGIVMGSLNYPKYSWFHLIKSAVLELVWRSRHYPWMWWYSAVIGGFPPGAGSKCCFSGAKCIGDMSKWLHRLMVRGKYCLLPAIWLYITVRRTFDLAFYCDNFLD